MAITASGGHAAGDTIQEVENVTGSSYSDVLIGDGGANALAGGSGADTLDGGAGSDTASFMGGNGVTVSLLIGSAQWGDAHGDTLGSIENLSGSAFFDELTGDTGANVLSGQGGDDFLNGSNGDDELNGGDGDDDLWGGAGADALDGGEGTDAANYSNSGAAVQVNLATGVNTGGDAAGDTLANVETVTGSALADTLTGGAGAETFNGGQGGDLLVGSAGADRLNGFQGSDTLSGVGGDDVLLGGAGDDWLNGGPGDDVLSGYLGADTFYYGLADFGDDVVIGFEDGVDMFHLGNTGLTFADFTETAAGPGTLLTLTADPANSILILGTPSGQIDAGDFV